MWLSDSMPKFSETITLSLLHHYLRKAHPAIKIANDAQTKAMKIMTEFGLTAKARTKLPRMETAESSPLEAFARTTKVESR